MNQILDENINEKRAPSVGSRVLNVIRVIDYFLFVMMLIGYLFRIQHWPYSFLIIAVSFSLFFISQVVRSVFARDKLSASIKVLGVTIMMVGLILWYYRKEGYSATITSGLLLFLAFEFIGTKKRT